MSNLSARINTKLLGYETKCVKCKHTNYFEQSKENDGEVLFSYFDNVVIQDSVCEKCGCNTFNVEVKLEVICK